MSCSCVPQSEHLEEVFSLSRLICKNFFFAFVRNVMIADTVNPCRSAINQAKIDHLHVISDFSEFLDAIDHSCVTAVFCFLNLADGHWFYPNRFIRAKNFFAYFSHSSIPFVLLVFASSGFFSVVSQNLVCSPMYFMTRFPVCPCLFLRISRSAKPAAGVSGS